MRAPAQRLGNDLRSCAFRSESGPAAPAAAAPPAVLLGCAARVLNHADARSSNDGSSKGVAVTAPSSEASSHPAAPAGAGRMLGYTRRQEDTQPGSLDRHRPEARTRSYPRPFPGVSATFLRPDGGIVRRQGPIFAAAPVTSRRSNTRNLNHCGRRQPEGRRERHAQLGVHQAPRGASPPCTGERRGCPGK